MIKNFTNRQKKYSFRVEYLRRMNFCMPRRYSHVCYYTIPIPFDGVGDSGIDPNSNETHENSDSAEDLRVDMIGGIDERLLLQENYEDVIHLLQETSINAEISSTTYDQFLIDFKLVQSYEIPEDGRVTNKEIQATEPSVARESNTIESFSDTLGSSKHSNLGTKSYRPQGSLKHVLARQSDGWFDIFRSSESPNGTAHTFDPLCHQVDISKLPIEKQQIQCANQEIIFQMSQRPTIVSMYPIRMADNDPERVDAGEQEVQEIRVEARARTEGAGMEDARRVRGRVIQAIVLVVQGIVISTLGILLFERLVSLRRPPADRRGPTILRLLNRDGVVRRHIRRHIRQLRRVSERRTLGRLTEILTSRQIQYLRQHLSVAEIRQLGEGLTHYGIGALVLCINQREVFAVKRTIETFGIGRLVDLFNANGELMRHRLSDEVIHPNEILHLREILTPSELQNLREIFEPFHVIQLEESLTPDGIVALQTVINEGNLYRLQEILGIFGMGKLVALLNPVPNPAPHPVSNRPEIPIRQILLMIMRAIEALLVLYIFYRLFVGTKK